MKNLLATATAFVIAACGSAEPVASRGSAPPPHEPAPTPTTIEAVPTTTVEAVPTTAPPALPKPLHPEGAIALECTVRAEIEATIRRDQLHLRFVLKNIGPNAATVTLRGRCPGGVVELGGLPATFDPMHRCQAGACVQPTTTQTYPIPGGPKSVTIGETTLTAKGDACNPPLPLGSTFLQALVTTDPHAFDVCSGAMVHVVRDPKTSALRLAGLLDEPVPATPPAMPTQKPAPKPAKPAPTVTPKKDCPVCGFACPNGIPSRKLGPDGCPSCSCERLDLSPRRATP